MSKAFNDGLLWSDGCYICTEVRVDAELEPRVVGSRRERLHRSRFNRDFQDFMAYLLTTCVSTSPQDADSKILISLRKSVGVVLSVLAGNRRSLLYFAQTDSDWFLPSLLSAMFVMSM